MAVRKTLHICCLVLLVGLSVPLLCNQALGENDHKDMQEIQHYALTMDNVTHFWTTFGSLSKVAESHPELKDALETDAEKQEDLAAIEKRVSSVPVIAAAITENGLTVHEFVLVQLVLFQSAFAAATVPAGPDRAKKLAEAGINPMNVDFVEQHASEIKALQEKYAPQGGSDNQHPVQ